VTCHHYRAATDPQGDTAATLRLSEFEIEIDRKSEPVHVESFFITGDRYIATTGSLPS